MYEHMILYLNFLLFLRKLKRPDVENEDELILKRYFMI